MQIHVSGFLMTGLIVFLFHIFQEFDLLFYSLSSARIFFRADLTAAEEKEQKDKGINSLHNINFTFHSYRLKNCLFKTDVKP